MHRSKEKNNSSRAILIGFGLIVLAVSIIFLKPYLLRSKKSSDTSQPSLNNSQDNSSKKMEAQDLMDKITNGADMNVIDVRDPTSFQQAHIVDSQNIPLANFSDAVSALDKNKTYVLVDQSEDPTLVAMVQNILAKNGYDKIYYLSGGFSNWQTLDLPAVADGDPQSFADQSKVNYIKSDDLKKAIDSGENLFIIDLRKSDAYSNGHIKNAVNIYLGDLEKKRSEIPMGRKVILVDSDGLWAFKGAVRLFDTGTFNVFALSDGLNTWQQKGYEMVK